MNSSARTHIVSTTSKFFSTPVKPDTEEPLKGELETSFKDEMNELGQSKVEEEKGEEADKKDEGEEVEDEDSIEWELRNTDSVFSELSELSRDYVESVDRGASVRGKCKFVCFFFLLRSAFLSCFFEF